MKVYWVIGYDRYYPSSDNFQESFETREEAENHLEHLASIRKKRQNDEWTDDTYLFDFYEIIDVSDRL